MEKITLTDNMKEQLQGLTPYNSNVPFSFTPAAYMGKNKAGEYHVDKSLWPVFTIRQMTKVERDAARTILIRNRKDQLSVSAYELSEMARKVTKSWSNLIDSGDGSEIVFASDRDGGADKDKFDLLPDIIKSAILTRAVEISGLSSVELLGFGC